MNKILYSLFALALTLSVVSCKKDDPKPSTEQTQSTALTAGYWEAEQDLTETNRAHVQITFKTDGTYSYHFLRVESSEQDKASLLSEFNDEFYASGTYSVHGNEVKLETFKLDRYADRFVSHRSERDKPEGVTGIVLIFDEQAQTLTPSEEKSPEDSVDTKAVLRHKF